MHVIGVSKEDIIDAPAQFLKIKCSFQQKSCQKIGFCPKLRGWRPNALENPGSAPGIYLFS